MICPLMKQKECFSGHWGHDLGMSQVFLTWGFSPINPEGVAWRVFLVKYFEYANPHEMRAIMTCTGSD
jgi:hypothetical protein